MKISGQGPVNPFKIYNQQQQLKQKDGKSRPVGDTLELSPEAKKVQELVRQGAELPEVRVELIREIRSRLENQTYHVSPQQLAESILKSMQEEK
jgi:flagellar biosynthesis anti-sigma factor FlgM